MKLFLSLLLILSPYLTVFGQEVQITLGPDEIGENQTWTITVTVHNDRLKSYDDFPEIKGFRKLRQFRQSTTSIVKGQTSSSESVVMRYEPMQQSTINVLSFAMKVNDKSVSVAGKNVKVGPAQQQQDPDPFKSFFDRSSAAGETEFVDIKEDAFLALTTSKDQVYVGEGFDATLSFFVSHDNQAPLQFYELEKQLPGIVRKIRPTNCREQNFNIVYIDGFNIENIDGDSVRINDRDYTQYRIYQATFFPLNADPINFPVVGLEMIKYKVAKHPSFTGQNRKEDFKKFFTNAKTVNVIEY